MPLLKQVAEMSEVLEGLLQPYRWLLMGEVPGHFEQLEEAATCLMLR